MGIDFTSMTYPYVTEFLEATVSDESHSEPAGENIKSSVVDIEHPLFSATGLKNVINFNRSLGNTSETLITGTIPDQVIKDLVSASFQKKFPFDLMVFAADIVKKLDERTSASDAESIADKHINYAKELQSVLGRQPLNAEVFMAGILNSSSKVKTVLDKAKNSPTDLATSLGSTIDDIVLKKYKNTTLKSRTNKEVYQFFYRRMQVGTNVFPYLPLGSQ